jgi:hypothetical protein
MTPQEALVTHAIELPISHSDTLRRVDAALRTAFIHLVTICLAAHAYAGGSGFFGGIASKISELNGELVTLGGVAAVTGLIWAFLGIMFGVAGTAKAISVFVCGIGIAAAPQLASFFTN